MFQFTGFPSTAYGLGCGYMRVAHVGFPIQTSADHRICAPPRSFSQLITSALSAKASTLRSYWLDLLDGMYSVTYLHGFGSLNLLC